ncbi:MAG: hypothetical protein RL885_06315 [Planctomycetota bacterium]
MSLDVRVRCPECEIPVPGDPQHGTVGCRRCQQVVTLEGALPGGEPIETCAVCGGRTFYIEKAVNRALGLALVVGAAIVSVIIFYFDGAAATLFLLIFALVDRVMYFRLPLRAVCYECLTEYQGLPMNERHRPFDLAIFEGIRQRRLREAEEQSAADEVPATQTGS